MCPVGAIMSSTPRTENKSEKEKILHCISLNFKCSLKVGQYDTVLQLSKRLGNMLNRPPSELALICKGKVLSRYPMSNLEALGIFSSSTASKLLISQRPPGPNWVRLTIVFLCSSSLSPVVFYMHTDSLICRVQCQLREHLRCAVAQFALHLADGAALPEDETLRNLGVADDDRIYCRVLSEEPRPVPPSAMAAAAAAVRVLVLRADAAHFAGAGRKRPGAREADRTASSRPRATAPATFQRRQIFDAVVLHRLEQSLEPLASGRVVRRRGGQDRDQLGDGAKDRAAKSA